MIYSWATRLRGLRRFSYRMRRIFETWAAVYLPLIIALALIGVIPDAAEWLADPKGVPLAPESGAGGGILALLAGMIAAGAAFLRSGERVTGMLRERGFKVSGGFTAALAAALLLFGVLLITHDLAGHVLGSGSTIWTIFAFGILLVLVSAFAVNLNHISLGRFYRDRLMETFMPGYDAALACRTGAAPPAADEMKLQQSSYSAPYHIINTNVVLVNAKDRRRHIRGGDNCILTPEWCGSNATGWCRTGIFMNNGIDSRHRDGDFGRGREPEHRRRRRGPDPKPHRVSPDGAAQPQARLLGPESGARKRARQDLGACALGETEPHPEPLPARALKPILRPPRGCPLPGTD